MNATLGDLMKSYEHAHRAHVPKGDYVLMRLDGKAFHSYTKKLKRPYDMTLMEAMDRTLLALCEQIPGVRLGYVESDEISLLITNWHATAESDSNPAGRRESEFWMGGVQAKMLSLSAAIATAAFNGIREAQANELGLTGQARADFHRGPALFDSRLWTFPGSDEGFELVKRYFTWRMRDSVKNSVTMAALAHFSHKAIHGLKTAEKQVKLSSIEAPWEALPAGFRFGRAAVKRERMASVTFVDKRTDETKTTEVLRKFWDIEAAEDLGKLWAEGVVPKP